MLLCEDMVQQEDERRERSRHYEKLSPRERNSSVHLSSVFRIGHNSTSEASARARITHTRTYTRAVCPSAKLVRAFVVQHACESAGQKITRASSSRGLFRNVVPQRTRHKKCVFIRLRDYVDPDRITDISSFAIQVLLCYVY